MKGQLCLECITQTKAQRILQAMTNEKLNDDKPSQFLRRIERLLGCASQDVAGQPDRSTPIHHSRQKKLAARTSAASQAAWNVLNHYSRNSSNAKTNVFLSPSFRRRSPKVRPTLFMGVTTPALDANGRRVVRNSQPLSVHNRRLLIDNWAAVSLQSATASQKQQARPASNEPILQAIKGEIISARK
ncbi:Small ribosomal subunit protein uS9m [Trichinella spiralis]|uniref:Small ribosomal subunit protein uS9m n=1 Tax=Trichinella spiralis TaxID=6334 RepID=A0ABR3K8Z1_TRISP